MTEMIFNCSMCGSELDRDCYYQRADHADWHNWKFCLEDWRNWKFCMECWQVSQSFLHEMLEKEREHNKEITRITEAMQATCRKEKNG